ncbi:MAG: helix-turn-helix domain-containing protein [Hyphomicrobiaceae bacterium]|nr:helix-turn-helix domain-containing protein [Hyphomicrobiaceae bacterium]
MSELLSHARMAKMLGMSPNGLRKHVEAGNIPVAEQKGRFRRYDPEAAKAAYRDNVDQSKTRKDAPSARPARGRGTRKRSLMDEAASAPSTAARSPDSGQSFNKAKTAEKIFQAKLKEAQYKEKIGTLVSLDEVKQASFDAARTLRDKLMALPAQLSPFVSQEDMPTVTKMIHEFIKDLQEAARKIAD